MYSLLSLKIILMKLNFQNSTLLTIHVSDPIFSKRKLFLTKNDEKFNLKSLSTSYEQDIKFCKL
jgi:hypothetical protein